MSLKLTSSVRGRLGVIQGCEPPLIKLNPEMGTDCKQAQAGQQ